MDTITRLYTIEDLEYILDSLPCSIYLKDNEGRYIYANKFAANISGLEKDMIIGKTDFNLRDSLEASKISENDKHSLETGASVITEEYGLNKTNNSLFSTYKLPIMASNTIASISRNLEFNRALTINFQKTICEKPNINIKNNYLDFIVDILNKLSSILDASLINIFLFNYNDQRLKHYAASNRTENIFKDNSIIYITDEEISNFDSSSTAFKDNKAINSYFCNYYKNEYLENNNFSFEVQPLYFANKLIGLVHITYDTIAKYQIHNKGFIKEICLNLSELLVSFNITKEFEQYTLNHNTLNPDTIFDNEYSPSMLLSKMNYFATLSHEFKTPINIILSSIQLLLKLVSDNYEVDNHTLLKYLNILKQNSYRLLRLVNNVLDSSKLENNFHDLTLVDCNIVSIIENIVLSTCDYLEQNHKNIIFDTDEEEVFLSCDPDKIEKVLLNLISNSLKFTDENGEIKVKLCTDHKNKRLFVHVQNNGPEISIEDSKKIFSRFVQSDELFSKKNQGTGIGLFLCKSFIELHGGNIWVNPHFKDGAEFIFYLPIQRNDDVKIDTLPTDMCASKIEKCHIEFSDVYSL